MDKIEVLGLLEPDVERLIAQHEKARGPLWMPSQLLFPKEGTFDGERLKLLQNEATKIPPALRAVFVLNSLTEAGLPDFLRLLTQYVGDKGPWGAWNDLWTAEEDRHDGLMHDLLRYTQFVDVSTVEELQYQYLRIGFRPEWKEDPYQLIAYAMLQEQATQVSHGNMAKFLKSCAPAWSIPLGYIAGEEGRHALFYRSIFERILTRDPEAAVISLWKVVETFQMPGGVLPGYKDLSYAAIRTEVFTPEHFGRILEQVFGQIRLTDVMMGTREGVAAKQRLLEHPSRVAKFGQAIMRRAAKPLTFSFLSDPVTI